MSAQKFWEPFEHSIDGFDELVELINKVAITSEKKGRRFAWRGQVNADWPLHSSLYRKFLAGKSKAPDEMEMQRKEGEILANLHRWGLHSPMGRGRLSILNQLAMLQHYGAPTRLVDISFNAWVGVFFAVEKMIYNGVEQFSNADGRIFLVDITDKLINEDNLLREWEDDLHRPWKINNPKIEAKQLHLWETSYFAWKPSSVDQRIFAQNGGFLMGGVPATKKIGNNSSQVPKGTNLSKDGHWKIDELRKFSSLALRPHKFDPNVGAPPVNPVYTFRIKSTLKLEIRRKLENIFGYNHSTIYPDYSGFAGFGIPDMN